MQLNPSVLQFKVYSQLAFNFGGPKSVIFLLFKIFLCIQIYSSQMKP
jgi:hypothetical protein